VKSLYFSTKESFLKCLLRGDFSRFLKSLGIPLPVPDLGGLETPRKSPKPIIHLSSHTLCTQKTKEGYSGLLTLENIRSFNWLLSLISLLEEITNQSPDQSLMLPSERRTSNTRSMHKRQTKQGHKNLLNCLNSSQLVRNRTKNPIDPQEIPLRHNMGGSRIGVGRNVVIRVSQPFRPESYQKSSHQPHPKGSHQIFGVVIRIKIYPVTLPLDSLRISRPILMQSSLMSQTQSCLNKGQLIVQAEETIQSRIIYTKSSPKPSHNRTSHHRQSTCLASNHCPSPQTHLSPRQYISNKSSQNHDLLNNHTKNPHQFTWLSITSVILSTKLMQIHHPEKEAGSIGMQISQQPSERNVSHLMLHTMECLIYVSSIMHCLKNSGSNLKDLTLSPQDSPIIIGIQIGRSRISNQMVVDHSQNRLFLQTSSIIHCHSHHVKKRSIR